MYLHEDRETFRDLIEQVADKSGRTALQDIRKVIAPLCDAYRQIQDQNSSGPVMNNSQTVYAGLTYGRNQLTENMADQGSNRGMLV